MKNFKIFSDDPACHHVISFALKEEPETEKEIFFLSPRFNYEGYADVIEFALSILPKGNKVIICNSYEPSYQRDCIAKYPGLESYKNLIFLQLTLSPKKIKEIFKACNI